MTDTAFTVQKLTAVPQTPTTPSTVFLVALPDKATTLRCMSQVVMAQA